jgi:hypothetical protein
MSGGSGSQHLPYAKISYDKAFLNLAAWARWGDRRKNFIGLMAVQWHGNMLDDWLPDYAAAADYAWTPPRSTPPFAPEMARVRRHLARLADAAKPRRSELDPPCWDGIWLKRRWWYRDVMTGKKVIAPRP